MINNPGKTVTIYDIPGIVNMALPRAINPINIISGFQATGIAPYNREVFTDDEFLSSAVTERRLHKTALLRLGQATLMVYSPK
jgi:hypothetical protein